MEDQHLPLELQLENHPQNHKLSILNKAAHAMTAPHDLDTALEQMIIEVKTLLAAESATIFLRPPLGSKLVVTTVATPEAKLLIGKKLPEGAGIANWALHERQPIWLDNAQDHPYFYDGIDTVTGLTTRSILAVPMLFKEKPVGVIEVINKLVGQFDEHDAELVKPIAHATAIAISNAQLTEESEHRTHQLTVLHELDQAISTSLRVNDIYNAFAQHAGRLLPYDNLAINLLDEGELRLAYQTGEVDSPWSADEIVPSRNSILSWVTSHRQPLLRHDVVTTARFAEDKQLVALGIQSTLTVPLRVKGKIIGTWHLGSQKKGTYHPDELDLAQSMADQVAISIENAHLFQQVREGQKRLKVLAQQIVAAQEQERQRLSRELHDEAGQALTALKIGLELLQSDLAEQAELRDRVGEAVSLTEQTMEMLRMIARDLRPPALDTAGLDPTLDGLCREFAHRTHIGVTYTSNDVTDTPLPDLVNICLYRFLQETLTNVAKHAQADHINVTLRFAPTAIQLTVQDNGLGFGKPGPAANDGKLPKGIGLLGLQERLELLNGTLTIESNPGRGAKLVAQVPLEAL